MAGRSAHEPRTALERLLRQQDRTYEEVAAEFERQARVLGERGLSITPRHLRRLASGERSGTNPATRRVLHAMFDLPVDTLLRPLTTDIPVVPSPTSHHERELLEMAAEESRRFAFGRELPVSREVIDGLHDEVRELTTLFITQPLPNILGRLVEVQSTTLAMLERRQTPSNARELYFLASVVAALLANAANDISRPELAMNHARTAYLWADYTEHDGLRTWIRALQSFICFWADRPREAVRYAELGTATAGTTTGTAAAWLHASHARAWAALGNADEAKILFRRAEAATEQARPDELDELGGLCTFSSPKYLYYAGRALAALPGQSALAEQFSADAVAAYQDPNQAGWDRACMSDSRISLALARASRGEIAGAAETLAPVLAIAPEDRIHDLHQTMQLVRRSLTAYDSLESVELQEQIEVFTRSSLRHVLG